MSCLIYGDKCKVGICHDCFRHLKQAHPRQVRLFFSQKHYDSFLNSVKSKPLDRWKDASKSVYERTRPTSPKGFFKVIYRGVGLAGNTASLSGDVGSIPTHLKNKGKAKV